MNSEEEILITSYSSSFFMIPSSASSSRNFPNVLEFKEILKNKKTLPFELMQNYIKDSRVDYQRNLSTLSKAYHHPCDAFCEEVLELICNHIGE